MGRLHRLVERARHDDVRAAIADGADVNEESRNLTPLEEAIHNNDVLMVQILIEAGADVNHGHPKTGKRPLHDAVTKDLRILETLLAAGADVNGCKENDTPLCTAALFSKQEAYDRLLAAGANPNATRGGKTAAELFGSFERASEIVKERMSDPFQNNVPDRYAKVIQKMMEEFPTVEEYAAHRGRGIYVYGLDQSTYTDPELEQWAKRLGEILRTPGMLQILEEKYLTGAELESAEKERRRTERYLARVKTLEERVAKANQEI